MARKTALEIEMKRCVHACARAETTGERAAIKGALVALLRESRKKGRRKRTYGFECADGLRGAGTSQRIKGPKLMVTSVRGVFSGTKESCSIPFELKGEVASPSRGMKPADEEDARH